MNGSAKLAILECLLVVLAYVVWMIFSVWRNEALYFTTMTPYWVRHWIIRRFGSPTGHCPHCGYNLRANQSGTCPECGNAATPVIPPRPSELPPQMWPRVLITAATAVLLLIVLVIVILTR